MGDYESLEKKSEYVVRKDENCNQGAKVTIVWFSSLPRYVTKTKVEKL